VLMDIGALNLSASQKLKISSPPTRAMDFASLSPRGRGIEGEGVVAGSTFNIFSRRTY
jgi:hypothetical protein